MLTEKDYCDYDTCVALHELGYDCQVIHLIAEKITLYEAQKWLREEKDIIVDVSFSPFGYFASMYTNVRNVESEILKERFKFEWSEKLYGEEEHDSYEGALLECIKEAVKILKDNRKQALESENTEYDYGHNVYHEEL